MRDLDDTKKVPKTKKYRAKKEKKEVEDTSCAAYTYDSDGNYVELDPITLEEIKKN